MGVKISYAKRIGNTYFGLILHTVIMYHNYAKPCSNYMLPKKNHSFKTLSARLVHSPKTCTIIVYSTFPNSLV